MNAPFTFAETLVVLPTLNEASHIGPLIDQLLAEADAVPLAIVVADGGSTDGTIAIVEAIAARDPRVVLIDNPDKIQSAGINRAVALFGGRAKYLIRIDAHSHYPPDYCRGLLIEAERVAAESVVVAMRTEGEGCFQRAVAAAQNSRLGAGNSGHRVGAKANYVDHGHHALIRADAFRAIDGYDPAFSHNEDAEFDLRLAANGGRIWQSDRVSLVYNPRNAPGSLFRQYRNYGRGRAMTIAKHHAWPKLRQLIPATVAPATAIGLVALVVAAFGAPLAALLALPMVAWAGASLAFGAFLRLKEASRCVLFAGPAAMIMHFAWSLGFWEGLLKGYRR
ncbi:glycosyltransferase family 2 protein [Acuticoccus sp. M5D2P5]|uniref:glycosyltransferase family 2 protein n=1 Tax=Acuticoccus kalidii TaxID=2910977 RepID=UPI001F28BAD3|nr:glycosyltransferase family 2 protein [Acuticoccus kalidii]MCF3931923.1 glycosyltransferase family 2 protein [Acuticoccus kalidii]